MRWIFKGPLHVSVHMPWRAPPRALTSILAIANTHLFVQAFTRSKTLQNTYPWVVNFLWSDCNYQLPAEPFSLVAQELLYEYIRNLYSINEYTCALSNCLIWQYWNQLEFGLCPGNIKGEGTTTIGDIPACISTQQHPISSYIRALSECITAYHFWRFTYMLWAWCVRIWRI